MPREITTETAGPRDRKKARPVAAINSEVCDRSPGCPVVRVCPKNAVVPDDSGAGEGRSSLFGLFGGSSHGWKVDEDACTGCLLCAQYCPMGAVEERERNQS